MSFGRFFGEVKSDLRFFDLRLAGGMEMILDDEIRSRRHFEREAVRKEMRLRADRPTAERKHLATGAHAAVAGFGPL